MITNSPKDQIRQQEKHGLSIIMPCYNSNPKHIEAAIRSILRQPLNCSIEILIIDDASTDNDTQNYLQNLAQSNNPQIKVIRQSTNSGPSAARNKGLVHAQYRYILPIDSDDELKNHEKEKSYLQDVVDHLSKNQEIDMVYAGLEFFGALEGRLPLPTQFDLKLLLILANTPLVFCGYRRKDALQAGGYPHQMKGAEDWAFTIRLLTTIMQREEKTPNMKILDYVAYRYRIHSHGHNVDSSHGQSYRDIFNHVVEQSQTIISYAFIDLEGVPYNKQIALLYNKYLALSKRLLNSNIDDGAKTWLTKHRVRLGRVERTPT